MRIFPLTLFTWLTFTGIAQTSYSGRVGKDAVTLVTYQYSDGIAVAYYMLDEDDTPKVLEGQVNDARLSLFEKDSLGQLLTSLFFPDFDQDRRRMTGRWMSRDGRERKISLRKDFDIDEGEEVEWDSQELLQSRSTENHYFKSVISKSKGEFFGRITGIKVFEKKTDRLIQTISLSGQLSGIDQVETGDYNFDGREDFSVFEAAYAGPNTSRIYYLRDPASEHYFLSEIAGISLEFDQNLKLVYEHSQCCAGRGHMNATYKIVDNKMVLVTKTCLEYDEQKDDFIEVPCE